MRERALLVVLLVVLATTGAIIAATLAPQRIAVSGEPLPWTAEPLSRSDGRTRWVLAHSTVRAGSVREDPRRRKVAIGDASRSLALDGYAFLHVIHVTADAGTAVVVLDEVTEGAGPTLEFVLSSDDGEHWEHRTLPKPTFATTIDEFLIEWPLIRVTMTVDDGTSIEQHWQRWPRRLLRELLTIEGGEGVYVAESHDGAKHFTLTPP